MAMSINELVKLNRKNIKTALVDYGKHTLSHRVLEDVSDVFIDRLAEDAADAKYDLYELLSTSPAWNEDLQAVVINGTRTHDPDYLLIRNLGWDILRQSSVDIDDVVISRVLEFFADHKASFEKKEEYIRAIETIAPEAYKPNKKKSRVFKSICDAMGVTDNTAGSEFQRLFAKFADELSTKKLDFKLILSINPAHFLTMSNPKDDMRGSMLTSCHSFNSVAYDFNNGCVGYARDEVTMIAFTVAHPDNPEEFNNRKTSRQLYMYNTGNGVLLQSRLYNTAGGTTGAQKDSRLYRDLVQRELSELEGVPNLWKTYPYLSQRECRLQPRAGFGGYPDWHYKDFAARISIRADHASDFRPFSIGTYGLCVVCGREISAGLYCDDCKNRKRCADCGAMVDSDTLFYVYDENGQEARVCRHCLSDHYFYCDRCDRYHHDNDSNETADGYNVCTSCLETYYTQCSVCGRYFDDSELYISDNGEPICAECLDEREKESEEEENN